MKIEDIFLEPKGGNVPDDVKYWKNRAYIPNFKDFLKYHICRVLLRCFHRNVVWVIHSRMDNISLEMSSDYRVVTLERELITTKELFENHILLMPINYWYWKILCAMENGNVRKVEKYLKDMSELMRKMRVQALISVDMHYAYARALSYAAHLAGVPVAFYEHGVMRDEKIIPCKMDFYKTFVSEFTDYYWYWGMKGMVECIELGISGYENSYVIGYPYKFSVKEGIPENRKSVLFVGNVGLNDCDNAGDYYDIVRKVYLFCKQNGIDFTYRSHKEKNAYIEELQKQGMRMSTGSLRQDLENNYIVVGANTTAVLEASLYGDFAIQVVWDYDIVHQFLFESAYHVSDAESVVEMIGKAVDAEMKPKKVLKENLMYGDLREKLAEAIEGIRKEWKYGER